MPGLAQVPLQDTLRTLFFQLAPSSRERRADGGGFPHLVIRKMPESPSLASPSGQLQGQEGFRHLTVMLVLLFILTTEFAFKGDQTLSNLIFL